jgi:uncharacterized delta-60 repeat protein
MSAVPGTLDTTGFGAPNGYVSANYWTSALSAGATAALELPNGGIVVGGAAQFKTNEFALVSYNSDGSLNKSFGTNGTVATVITSEKSQQPVGVGDSIDSLFYQTNGDIVAVGLSYVFYPLNAKNNNWTSTDQFVTLAEYKPNGTLDTSFGTGGISQTLIVADSGVYATQVKISAALQPSGDIVVGLGRSGAIYKAVSELVRFTPSGALDTTFGSAGTGFEQLAPLTRAPQIAVEPDGSILVDAAQSGNYIAHYLPNGTFDTTFGDLAVNATSIALEPGSGGALNLVLAMPGNPGELERYDLSTPDGGAQTATLDTTFGVDGVATLPTGYSISTGGGAGAVAVEPQLGGDIIVQGSGNGGVAPIAFTASGAIDTSYGPAGNGIGSAMLISGGSSIEDVSGQTGYGDLLIAGSLNDDFAVARYLAPTTVTNMATAGSASAGSIAEAVMARRSSASKPLAGPMAAGDRLVAAGAWASSLSGLDQFFGDYGDRTGLDLLLKIER